MSEQTQRETSANETAVEVQGELFEGERFGGERLGKDEMNLVEHPFASLSKEKDTRVIQLEWTTRHPVTGQERRASWRVAGDPHLGLPTANDEKVYLVAMELTREGGWEQTVFFTRHEFVKRLGWSHDQHSYRRLSEAFQRLASVTISATNAFWNPKRKSFYDGYFNLLEVIIASGDRGRKKAGPREEESYFKWSDIVFDAMRGGNIRTLDLEFALSLERPLSLRLFRVLDKKTHGGRRPFSISVNDLCRYHLGMVTDGRYESNLKASLDPAHNELIQRGFLSEAAYEPMKTRRGSKVSYRIALPSKSDDEQPAQPEMLLADEAPGAHSAEPESPTPFQLLIPFRDSEPPAPQAAKPETLSATSPTDRASLQSELEERGVSALVARELCAAFAPDAVRLQIDCLDDREPKNPPAALVKAIKQGWNPPPKFAARQKATRIDSKRPKSPQGYLDPIQGASGPQKAAEREKRASEKAEADRLEAAWENLDPQTQENLDRQARERLGVLGHAGRAPAALQAMRRTLLRDVLQPEQNAPS